MSESMKQQSTVKAKSFEFVKDKYLNNLDDDTTTKTTSTLIDASKRFVKNPIAMIGLVLFAILLFSSIIIPLLPSTINPYITSATTNAAPSSAHWFGTDSLGRDNWARDWYGLRNSIAIGFVSGIINIVIAIVVGLLMAYFVLFDNYFKYIIKMFYAFPTILILILLSVTFGESFYVLIIGLIVSGWVGASQMIRAQALKVKSLNFITVSQTLGTGRLKVLWILFVYSLPMIIIQFVIMIPSMILASATLGFLGLSVPNVPTLGMQINNGRDFILTNPTQVFIPLIMLIALTVSIQFVGVGLEDGFVREG